MQLHLPVYLFRDKTNDAGWFCNEYRGNNTYKRVLLVYYGVLCEPDQSLKPALIPINVIKPWPTFSPSVFRLISTPFEIDGVMNAWSLIINV